MNTAITITAIICTTLIFFGTLMFLSTREERELKKKELEIKKVDAAKDIPKELINYIMTNGGNKNGESNNDKH